MFVRIKIINIGLDQASLLFLIVVVISYCMLYVCTYKIINIGLDQASLLFNIVVVISYCMLYVCTYKNYTDFVVSC